jgi:hypothetical protein
MRLKSRPIAGTRYSWSKCASERGDHGISATTHSGTRLYSSETTFLECTHSPSLVQATECRLVAYLHPTDSTYFPSEPHCEVALRSSPIRFHVSKTPARMRKAIWRSRNKPPMPNDSLGWSLPRLQRNSDHYKDHATSLPHKWLTRTQRGIATVTSTRPKRSPSGTHRP